MNPSILKGRSLLTWIDYTPEEIRYFLSLSKKVKEEAKKGMHKQRFKGKTMALLFEKRSTRTRCAFETAFGEEGGHPVFLSNQDIQLGAKESIEDTARVLGRMFDAIEFRGYKQEYVEILAKYSGVPVYNGLTDLFHPTQALADVLKSLMTMVPDSSFSIRSMEPIIGKTQPSTVKLKGSSIPIHSNSRQEDLL